MDIGEFSNMTGISIDTLRYYDKIGLLRPERVKCRRCYTDTDAEKANAVARLKGLSFSLDEIKTLFDLDKSFGDDEKLDDDNRKIISRCLEIVRVKYGDVLRKEKEIVQVKTMLEKMISKTNKLLELGHFFREDEE